MDKSPEEELADLVREEVKKLAEKMWDGDTGSLTVITDYFEFRASMDRKTHDPG
jgi:hypothetical protein